MGSVSRGLRARREILFPLEPFLPGDPGLVQYQLEQVHPDFVAPVRIWEADLNLAFHHVMVPASNIRSLPPQRAKAFDEIIAGYGGESHPIGSNNPPARFVNPNRRPGTVLEHFKELCGRIS